jgi:hypothetical protein
MRPYTYICDFGRSRSPGELSVTDEARWRFSPELGDGRVGESEVNGRQDGYSLDGDRDGAGDRADVSLMFWPTSSSISFRTRFRPRSKLSLDGFRSTDVTEGMDTEPQPSEETTKKLSFEGRHTLSMEDRRRELKDDADVVVQTLSLEAFLSKSKPSFEGR